MLLDLLTVAVLAWVGSRLVLATRASLERGARQRVVVIVRGLRPRHFLPVPVVLTVVAAAAYALTAVPLLALGWWEAIGGTGNPVFGVTDSTAGTPLETIVPLAFLALLVPAMPLLVEREEVLFRLGAERWSPLRRTGMTLLFGIVHAVIGIPVGVALALSLGGAYFLACYLRGHRRSGGSRAAALLESTRAHLAYNLSVVVLVLLYVAEPLVAGP